MQFLRATSSPAKTALVYITVGTLTVIWTTVYFFYRYNAASETDPVPYYWIAGFLATGLALLVIGLATGRIGKSAKPAESGPPVSTTPVAVVEGQQPIDQHLPVAAVLPNGEAPVVAQPARPMHTVGV